jgi:chromosome segregation ATPase
MVIEYNKFGKSITKHGKILGSGGPRDLQRKQNMSLMGDDTNLVVIETLKEQIRDLTKELSTKSNNTPTGFFSAEEVDDEINKAVKEAVIETKNSMLEKINKLQEELKLSKNNNNLDIEKNNNELSNKVTSLEIEISSLKNKIKELKSRLNTVEILEEKLKHKDEIIKNKDDVIESLKRNISYDNIEDTIGDRPSIENIFVDPLEKNSGNALESFIKVDDLSHKEKEDISDKVNKLKNLIGGKLPNRVN